MIINIKVSVIKHFEKNYQINPKITEQLYDEGILTYKVCRDLLLRDEYRMKAQSKERNRLKLNLADKYSVSFASVEKIDRKSVV